MPAQIVYDGDAGFPFGMDAERAPHLLAAGWYSKGVNVKSRRGVIEPRDGYHYCPLRFSSERAQEIFETGKFQGIDEYNGKKVAAVSGHLFSIDGDYVQQLTDEERLDQYVDIIYMAQLGSYFVAQDASNAPLIFDGDNVRRSDVDAGEVPIGRAMAYGNGRSYVVDRSCTFVYASRIFSEDLTGSSSPIDFTESPRSFRPYGIGEITALGFTNVLDSASGIGPLIVFGTDGSYAFDVTIPRDEWALSQFGRKVGSEFNAVSHQALQEHGSDLFFRTEDGIETIASARSESDRGLTLDLSYPVSPWLRLGGWLEKTQSSKHRNIIRWTVNHVQTVSKDLDGNDVMDICALGMVRLDTANRASSGIQAQPAWDGLETGLCIVGLHDDCIFSRDCDGRTRLYQIVEGTDYDIGPKGRREIEWDWESRAYDFGAPMTPKDLTGKGSIDLSRVGPATELAVLFRPDSFPCFKPLTDKGTFCKPAEKCPKCITRTALSYFRFPVPSPQESGDCDPLTGRSAGNVTRTQLRIEGRGPFTLERLRLQASVKELAEESCPDRGRTCPTIDCCPPSDFRYSILTCDK